MEEGDARGGKIVSGLLGQERQEGKVGRKILLPLFLFPCRVINRSGRRRGENDGADFLLLFPPYVNLENHVRKRRNIAGRGNKRRSSTLWIFLCPEGYGKEEERKTAEAPFCHKAAKRGGTKGAGSVLHKNRESWFCLIIFQEIFFGHSWYCLKNITLSSG